MRAKRHVDAMQDSALTARLHRVYWVGGGSGAGKSTVARRLAAANALHLYSTDDVMADHGRRSAPDEVPLASRFAAMDMDERWLNRTPRTMLETFHWFKGEAFDLILEDLLSLPEDAGVVVEGFRLLPRLVKPLLAVPRHAVWLLPTPEFRQAAWESRGELWTIAGKTSDPPRALRNLLERDRMFTERLREETKALELSVIEVDIAMTEDQLTELVTELFQL